MPYSSAAIFSRETNNSTQAYAMAADDASYKYYNNMSWSMWVASSPGLNKTLFSMWETGTAKRSWLFSTQDNGTFRTIFSWDGTSFSLHTSADVIFDRSWLNIVITFTNGTQVVYVNGVVKTMNQTIAWGGGAVGLFPANVRLMVGGIVPTSPTADNSIGGSFNNYQMFNKVLTQAEVTELYNNGCPMDSANLTTVANNTNHWPMDQRDTLPTLTDVRAGAGANMSITKSGTNPFFNRTADYPTYSSDPLVGNVRAGTTYVLDGSNKTGTAVIVSLANTKTGVAGDGGTGTYDGSDRHTDPGIANVRSGAAYKDNSTSNNRIGTMVANLAADTKIGVASDGGTGTYVAAERYTDPGITNVAIGTAYTFNAAARVGTKDQVTNIVGNNDLTAPDYGNQIGE